MNAVVPRPMKTRGSHGSPVTAAITASAAQNTQAHAPEGIEGSPLLACTTAPDPQTKSFEKVSILTSPTVYRYV